MSHWGFKFPDRCAGHNPARGREMVGVEVTVRVMDKRTGVAVFTESGGRELIHSSSRSHALLARRRCSLTFNFGTKIIMKRV